MRIGASLGAILFAFAVKSVALVVVLLSTILAIEYMSRAVHIDLIGWE